MVPKHVTLEAGRLYIGVPARTVVLDLPRLHQGATGGTAKAHLAPEIVRPSPRYAAPYGEPGLSGSRTPNSCNLLKI